MSKRAWVCLELLAAGALLFGSSSSSCVSQALRDTANQIDGAPQTLQDVSSLDDFGNWLDAQLGSKG